MLIYLFKPVLHILESIFLCAIINENDTHCSFIISLCNSSESFLTCSIPYLKLYSLVINIDCLNFEINSNSGHVTGREAVFTESQKNTTLTDR